MENKSLYENVNVKGKWIYKPNFVKKEQKVQNNDNNKNITETTEYCLRLEPGTFAMRSERHTSTPTARMKSKDVE